MADTQSARDFFDQLTASTAPGEGSDAESAKKDANQSASAARKRPRSRPYTCCDSCKTRKVRCDGGSPCQFCSDRGFACVHSQRAGTKKQKTSTGPLVVHPRPRLESVLFTASTRQYYLDLFLRKINPAFRVFDSKTISLYRGAAEVARPRSETFEEAMALAHAARALGHVEIATQLYQQARRYAGDLIDDFCAATAVGFALLVMYFQGEDNDKAMHYATIANSISQMSEKNSRTMQVAALIKCCHILEGPNRPCYVDCTPRPFQYQNPLLGDALSLADAWATPLTENMLDVMRTFPVHAELLDIYCRQKLVSRYPIEQRTDAYVPIERIEQLLIYVHEHAALMEKLFQARQDTLRLGNIVFLCSASGLVDVGLHYCRLLLAGLQAVPVSQATLASRSSVFMPAIVASNFVHMYKIHPFDRTADYRMFLRDICEIMRPLARIYKTSHAIVECLDRMFEEPTTPSRFKVNPDQPAILARWAADERAHCLATGTAPVFNFTEVLYNLGYQSYGVAPAVPNMTVMSAPAAVMGTPEDNAVTSPPPTSSASMSVEMTLEQLLAEADAAVPMLMDGLDAFGTNVAAGCASSVAVATGVATPSLGSVLELNLATGALEGGVAGYGSALNWDLILSEIP